MLMMLFDRRSHIGNLLMCRRSSLFLNVLFYGVECGSATGNATIGRAPEVISPKVLTDFVPMMFSKHVGREAKLFRVFLDHVQFRLRDRHPIDIVFL